MSVSVQAMRCCGIAGLCALALVVGALVACGSGRSTGSPKALETYRRIQSSNYYDLVVSSYKPGVIHQQGFRQRGGIARLARDYLLVTGDGRFFRFDWHGENGSFVIDQIPLESPLDTELRRLDASPVDRRPPFLDVLGIVVDAGGPQSRVFVSHHHWDADHACYTLRVSSADLPDAGSTVQQKPAHWEALFDSTPCIPILRNGQAYFDGREAGGRMILGQGNKLLLSVGDFHFDGPDRADMFSQDVSSSYGKTVEIDLVSRAVTVNTIGHRNPQGLHADAFGHIWLTEHGPKGGDELNLLESGANYGWPIITYGTQYGADRWRDGGVSHRSGEFRGPVFAWVPSVGISNLVRLRGDRFPAWTGDFMIASLAGKTLFRVHMQDRAVVLVEPLPMGRRIRDVLEGHDGSLVLWTDAGEIVRMIPETRHERGRTEFVRCGGCHRISADMPPSIGPDLVGILGRRIASVEGFVYSSGLKAQSGTWTKDSLDRFLADPAAFAPGSPMAGQGVGDPHARRAILEYLEWIAVRNK